MKLILISNNSNIEREHSILNELFDLGLETLHIRKPEYNSEMLRNYIEKIEKKNYSKIVLHSHYALIDEFQLKGAHFKFNNSLTNLNTFNQNFSKSVSCHNFEEINFCNESVFDYVFLSPIFDSISKYNYESHFEKKELIQFLNNPHKTEIIALSGIDDNNIEECKKLGFDGVAVLGAVWQSTNPISSFLKLREKIRKV